MDTCVKYFDHIISLGLNCEIAYQLHRNFHYVESSLLTWAGVSHDHLLEVLRNPRLIFSGAVKEHPTINMYRCLQTNINFHGKTPLIETPSPNTEGFVEFIAKERQDTIERVKYLAEKYIDMAYDQSVKLYILGIHPQFCTFSSSVLDKFLSNLAAIVIDEYCNSSILFIVSSHHKEHQFHCVNENNHIWLRSISHFAPSDKATFDSYMDNAAYDGIFAEFQPITKTQENKVYKFQKI